MTGSSLPPLPEEPSVVIRRAVAADAGPCGEICFKAFGTIALQHGFPPDFPGPEPAIGMLSMMFSHPGFFCVVAERDGKILGSNCMDERTPIAGIGPITVDPAAQNRAVGRRLMQAVIDQATRRKAAGIRLVQSAYHSRSLSLYAKMGFAVREFLACMQGPAIGKPQPGYRVRPARENDLAACNALCQSVHGHDRSGELADAIRQGTAVVAESDSGITAYATSVAFFGHAVGRTGRDVQAILAAAKEFQGPGILVPTGNSDLFRWCLENGLRVVQPMTLMTMGFYSEPAGAYLPSILF